MPKAATNVFTVEFTDTDSMFVNDAIITVVAKSPTAALAAALDSMRKAASELGKGTAFNRYSVVMTDKYPAYTVRAWRD